MTENQERQIVVEEARTWLQVPWRHMGRSRAGVDCGGLLIGVFKAASEKIGRIIVPDDFDTGYYNPDFMMHNSEQRFRGLVGRFCKLAYREPRDADIVLYQVGKLLAHCSIVDRWPRVIHAVRATSEVQYDDGDKGKLRAKQRELWTLKEWT